MMKDVDTLKTALRAAAETPFGCRSRAEIVRRNFTLIAALRDEFAVPWKVLACLFNEALSDLPVDAIAPETLCRLFNLEIQRRGFEHKAGQMPQNVARSGTSALGQSPYSDAVDEPGPGTGPRQRAREPPGSGLLLRARKTSVAASRFEATVRKKDSGSS